MENALVLQRDAYEKALEQASLVRDALRLLADADASYDLQMMAGRVLTRVAERYDLSMIKSRDRVQAQVFFVLLLNLALERATGGDAAKAARALQRVENIPKLLVVAEKLLDEPRRRIKTLLARNAFIVKDEDGRHCFELLPASTRDQLAHWEKVGLLQDNGWPLSTMAMRAVCLERIERAELEVKMGRKVDWKRILGVRPEGAFAEVFFARAVLQKPALSGGLWQPFLCSLYVNAMISEAWFASPSTRWAGHSVTFYLDDEIRRRVYISPEILRLFVERVVLETEELAEHYSEATFRVAQTLSAKQGGEAVFMEELSHADVLRVTKYAEELLRKLASDAFSFYLKATDASTDDDMDRFWHTRVLLTTPTQAHTRFARATAVQERAWERLGSVRSTRELAAVASGFVRWPQEQKEAFFHDARVWSGVLTRQTVSRDGRDGDALLHLFATMAEAGVAERLLDAVVWEDVHSSQFNEAAISTSDARAVADPWLGRAFGRAVVAGYSLTEARELFSRLRSEVALYFALGETASIWTRDEDWLRYFSPGAFFHFLARLQAVWNAMEPERRPLLVMLADGASLGRVLAAQTQEEAEAFVCRLNTWARTRAQRSAAIRAWTSHEGMGMREVLMERWPRVAWDALFTVRGAG